MNNTLATHFHDYFGVDLVAAGVLATAFGGMNLFARSFGGIASDWANTRWAMPGRLWAHFISLFGQAVFLFLFGCVTSDMGWPVALVVLIIFSCFVNAAEGTSYGIVPYMIPQHLAVVSAVVGAMYVPAAIYLILATWIKTCSQDTTSGKFNVAQLGKTTKAGFRTYVECCTDYRVFLMIFQYSACFGCELVMNNTLATHFHDYFGVDLVAAGVLATAFGGMNLFARSFGGIASDWANTRWAMPGRLWAHFISLFGQAVFLFLFGCVTSDMGWPVALVVLIIFSCFVNAAEGTSYGIVPYMIPQHLAVVSAVVGAGGTLGAVIATWSFYKYVEDDLLPFKLHGIYVAFWALTCFLMRWDHLGSMFGGPKTSAANEGEPKSMENPASDGA